uniref:Chromo domain-containing protein n=1 Tax=Chromera velia CCMP2878 TaxID=1169474 RepID=A0A0G4G8V8_9ALVE|eukprot:Cvel_586.t1-p1 / transcript=Cvel_586.t1 / gene=Cvel_586 / organism=Chromera_velia_CCMP2878 / gene_product=hypothetical protein / transcript_product=hypothetical protein / location=Cvel_scaffold18:72506-77513(-) / protein_length=1136 / sequence_SO=supercontig / SO=protein_coding / is_pseudo=false
MAPSKSKKKSDEVEPPSKKGKGGKGKQPAAAAAAAAAAESVVDVESNEAPEDVADKEGEILGEGEAAAAGKQRKPRRKHIMGSTHFLTNYPNCRSQETFLCYGSIFRELARSQEDSSSLYDRAIDPSSGLPRNEGFVLQRSAAFGALYKLWVQTLPENTAEEDKIFEKMVVRDIAVAKWHIVVLLENDTVFLWRQAHDDIVIGCNEWERLTELEGRKIVRVFLSGSSMQPNWRPVQYPDTNPNQIPDRFTLAVITETGEVLCAQGSQTLPAKTGPVETVHSAEEAHAIDVSLAPILEEPPLPPSMAILAKTYPHQGAGEKKQKPAAAAAAAAAASSAGDGEESVMLFVKGPKKGLLVHFDEFPFNSHPLKVVCGPRAEDGVVLLQGGEAYRFSVKLKRGGEKADEGEVEDGEGKESVQMAKSWMKMLQQMRGDEDEEDESDDENPYSSSQPAAAAAAASSTGKGRARKKGGKGKEEEKRNPKPRQTVEAELVPLKGSVENRKCVDCDVCGDEFVLVTEDGVLHEFNRIGHRTPSWGSTRPQIEEPCEFTPFWMREALKYYTGGSGSWQEVLFDGKTDVAWADGLAMGRYREMRHTYDLDTNAYRARGKGGKEMEAAIVPYVDPICRVFLFEGTTVGVRQSGEIIAYPNFLAGTLECLEMGVHAQHAIIYKDEIQGLVDQTDTKGRGLNPVLLPIPPCALLPSLVEKFIPDSFDDEEVEGETGEQEGGKGKREKKSNATDPVRNLPLLECVKGAKIRQLHDDDAEDTADVLLSLNVQSTLLSARVIKGPTGFIVGIPSRCHHPPPTDDLLLYRAGPLPKMKEVSTNGSWVAESEEKLTLAEQAKKREAELAAERRREQQRKKKEGRHSLKQEEGVDASAGPKSKKRKFEEGEEDGVKKEKEVKMTRKRLKEIENEQAIAMAKEEAVQVVNSETGEVEDEWVVVEILKTRTFMQEGVPIKKYLVDWGPNWEPTWEPYENLGNAEEKIAEYEAKVAERRKNWKKGKNSKKQKQIKQEIKQEEGKENVADAANVDAEGQPHSASSSSSCSSSSSSAAAAAVEVEEEEEETEGGASLQSGIGGGLGGLNIPGLVGGFFAGFSAAAAPARKSSGGEKDEADGDVIMGGEVDRVESGASTEVP